MEIKQRFEYVDHKGFQEIWRHTFDADLGEAASTAAGRVSTARIAVVPYGRGKDICDALSAVTLGLRVPSDTWDRG